MPALQITRKKSRRKRSVWENPLFWILLILLIGGIVAIIIWATSKKPSPGPGPSKLSFYVEDCQQSGNLKYDYDKLAKEFDFIVFDFSPNCYNSINTTIDGLKNSGYSGQLGIHFDQTSGLSCNVTPPDQRSCDAGGNPNCQTITNSCIDNLHTVIGDAAFSKIDAIIWEKEGNKLMNNCDSKSISCKKFFTNSFKKYPTSKFSEFAGWTTKFDFTVPQPQLASWDYIFYEYYNIFEGGCKSGGTKEENEGCFVDYNPPGGKCFDGATTGLNGKQAGCGAGKDTVYCSKSTTKAPLGQYMASVLVKKYNGNVPKIPDNQVDRTVIFFTFTNASNPTWLDTLTTPAEFNEFLDGFTSTLKAAGCDNIGQCKFGAWGCPKWIANSSSNFC